MLRTGALIICCFAFRTWLTAQNLKDEGYHEIGKADALLYQFKPALALEHYHNAMWMAREIPDDYLYAKVLFGIGQAIWYLGDYPTSIDTIKLAINEFKKLRNTGDRAAALRILSNIYDDQGNYEEAFIYIREALELYENYNDDQNKVLSLVQAGVLYKNIGDYETALDYYSLAQSMRPFVGEYPYRELNHRLGELYAARNKPDSALLYYRKAFTGNRKSKIIRTRIGQLYLLNNQTDSAFFYLDSVYNQAKRTTDVNIQILCMLGLGEIYLQRDRLPEAIFMAEGALEMSTIRGAKQTRANAFRLLSSIYEQKKDPAEALKYQKLYDRLKDSVISGQFKAQLFGFRQKIEESKQQATLKSLKAQKRLALQAIAVICLLAGFIIVLLRLRHKNDKLHFKQRAAELEMQALRAQMNPHFIFNCLSAINHFILKNEKEQASDYLTRFSRLIRLVLINAGKATIPLEEELAMLKLYLNMEQLRFKDAFDYYIYYDADVLPSVTFVPSFILQPFCENAIWHGLLHQDKKGELRIHFSKKNDVLICTIKDNGIGRQKAAEIKTDREDKQGSFGQKLSAERLTLFNGLKENSFSIEDNKDEAGNVTGTVVTLRINNTNAHD